MSTLSRMQNQETATEGDDGGSSTLESLPAELLVNVFKYTRTAEDLQALRLVSRKVSQAATTALQNLYKTIAIMPTRSSMARFTSLAKHSLVAPGIEEVVIFFLPPRVAPKDVEAHTGDFKIYLTEHGVPEGPFNDFMSKFNDDCFDSRDIDSTALGDRYLSSVIESGDFERCLALGIKNFTALSYVQMLTDIRSPLYGADDLILNLPLTPSILDRRNRYEYSRHTTAEHYLRRLALTHLYSKYLSFASPVDCIGALQNWPVTDKGRSRALTIGPIHAEILAGQESADWPNWATKLNQNPRTLHDYLSHVTLLSLSTDDGWRRVFNCALTGEADNLRQQCASNWAQLLQSAEHLTALRLQDESACQDPKFDNILHHVFTTCTWPALSELVIYRQDNMKLLPFDRNLFQCAKGWRLFRQQDMDAFLLRHKHTLQLLMLRNIVGVTERIPPPANIHGLGAGDAPTPSLAAFERSLRLWKTELRKLSLTAFDIKLRLIDTSADRRTVRPEAEAIESWIAQSEIHALAAGLGVNIYWIQEDERPTHGMAQTFDFGYDFGGWKGSEHDPHFKAQFMTPLPRFGWRDLKV